MTQQLAALEMTQLAPLDLGAWMAHAVGGSMVLAVPVAVLAGLVSFFSPCVLPLLPGYLSFATGLSAAQVREGEGRRGRILVGTLLFVLGFTVVFVATGSAIGKLGEVLLRGSHAITTGAGVLAILLGLVFLGVVPLGQRELRIHRVPRLGLVAAPLLGLAFGIGWTPCIGPALTVVLTLAANEASALRGGLLATCYSLGLGIPFVVAGLAMGRMARVLGVVRRHQLAVQRLGGIMMVLVGVLMVTGAWDGVMATLRYWAARFNPPI